MMEPDVRPVDLSRLKEEAPTFNIREKRRHPILIVISVLLGIFFINALVFVHFSKAPEVFTTDRIVEVDKGMSVQGIARMLKTDGAIRSEILFRAFVDVFGNELKIPSGAYYLSAHTPVWGVAAQFADGNHRIPMLKITFPEGLTNVQLGDILRKKIPQFPKEKFVLDAKTKQGYLFPNTYTFFATVSPDEVIEAFSKEFTDQTHALLTEIAASGHSLSDIVTMASLIEEEANDDESRRMVSGILWKRIAIGMPLQVDASFAYLLGKTSAELTADDLKTDSAFNTYTHKGLPPSPIANAGLDAIVAAIHPSASSYLYYLTGKDGTMHYAKTFKEHKSNKDKYLR